MIFDPVKPFIPAEFRVKIATERWELAGAARLRHAVFCGEQGLFAGDDRDALDAVAIPLVAVSHMGVAPHDVVGTVRVHEAEPGLWWGSRLAVAAECRRVGPLGGALIRLAVGMAHARGCRRFLAHVQSQNALLFRRLHWHAVDTIELHGIAHVRMEADLAYYPPVVSPEAGFHAISRKAA